MKLLVAPLCWLLLGVWSLAADEDKQGGTTLSPAKARGIFRLVEGQPELRDKDISVQLTLEGALIPEGLWTCVWIREGEEEVVVMQIRDRDGAYRKPNFADPASLKFAIRIDLREKVQAILRHKEGKKKPSRQ